MERVGWGLGAADSLPALRGPTRAGEAKLSTLGLTAGVGTKESHRRHVRKRIRAMCSDSQSTTLQNDADDTCQAC